MHSSEIYVIQEDSNNRTKMSSQKLFKNGPLFFFVLVAAFFFLIAIEECVYPNPAAAVPAVRALLSNDDHLVHRGSFSNMDEAQSHGIGSEKPAPSSIGSHWGYDENTGPTKWGGLCSSGRHQSPIDFRSSMLRYTSQIDRIHFVNYDTKGAVEVQNIGHTVKVSGFDKWTVKNRPYIHGGGLNGRYQLAQFHLHWASDNGNGSEHTVNGVHYPSELHLVHVREGLSLTEALLQPEGLAVVGVFLTLGRDDKALAPLEEPFALVKKKDATTIVFNYTVGATLPRNQENFYRYDGSLTTPTCDEAVIWSVFAEPITITSNQLSLLRQMEEDSQGHRVVVNNRPPQPLYGRPLFYRVSPIQAKTASFCACDSTDDGLGGVGGGDGIGASGQTHGRPAPITVYNNRQAGNGAISPALGFLTGIPLLGVNLACGLVCWLWGTVDTITKPFSTDRGTKNDEDDNLVISNPIDLSQ